MIADCNATEVSSVCSTLSEEKRLDSLLRRFYSGSIYVVLVLEKSLNKGIPAPNRGPHVLNYVKQCILISQYCCFANYKIVWSNIVMEQG